MVNGTRGLAFGCAETAQRSPDPSTRTRLHPVTFRHFRALAPARGTALAIALLLVPTVVQAQRLPGMPGSQGGTVAMHQAEFYAHVMNKVQESLEGWHEAWAGDDVEGLADRYAEDAVLALPGREPVWGRAAIQEALPTRLRGVGEAQVSIGDVSASGRMAYVGGRFQMDLQEEGGSGRQLTGYHSTVFYRVGSDWMIRSQVFHPDPPPQETERR